jgi:hypothetical protein
VTTTYEGRHRWETQGQHPGESQRMHAGCIDFVGPSTAVGSGLLDAAARNDGLVADESTGREVGRLADIAVALSVPRI